MGYLGCGTTQTLCTIGKPFVWQLELIRQASLKKGQLGTILGGLKL